MTRRYKIRTHESGNQDGSTETGTIVLHIGGSNTVEAKCIEDVETNLRKQVAAEKLSKGCVYQICPTDCSESLRSLAVALDGSFQNCRLDPAEGLYSEFRRIHLTAA